MTHDPMKSSEKSDLALPLAPQVSHGEDHALMPGEFAGMYQAGFDAGYENGKEAGYRQSFSESMAAVQQGPDSGAAVQSAVKGKPDPKVGSRRMLLGMPCGTCKVYFFSDETRCPCCKQQRSA